MPICREVNRVMHEAKDVRSAVSNLMAREPKAGFPIGGAG